jgi:8-oxo-dGTP diphosphatase
MTDSSKNPRVGLGIFIFNNEGKVFFVHRISKHATGTWAPPGGYLEFGETFEEGAKREVKEEFDLDVDDLKVIGVTNNVYENEGKHIVGILLKAAKFSGDPKIMEPDKHSKFGWFDLTNLPKPIMPPIRQYLDSDAVCFCGSGKKLQECGLKNTKDHLVFMNKV